MKMRELGLSTVSVINVMVSTVEHKKRLIAVWIMPHYALWTYNTNNTCVFIGITSSNGMNWLPRYDEICRKAENSGIAVNKETGNVISFDELDVLASQYDQVRNKVTADEFFNERLTTKPFEF